MKRSFNNTSLADEQSSQNQTTSIDAMEIDRPNEYQVAMKKVHLVERNSQPGGLQMVNSRHVGQHSATDIVELAREINQADEAIRNSATGKLSLILEQIQFLQSQAKKVLEETNSSKKIHAAACNFKKIPLKTYHMYRRESGQSYLSIISPEEWGLSLPHQFQGSFRLEHDQSWTPVDRLAEVTKKNLWAQRLLAATDDATATSSFLAIE